MDGLGDPEHLAEASARFPRTSRALLIGLLHDPGAFRHLAEGTAGVAFSRHTHRGQLGLLWIGLPLTFLTAFTQTPGRHPTSRGSPEELVPVVGYPAFAAPRFFRWITTRATSAPAASTTTGTSVYPFSAK